MSSFVVRPFLPEATTALMFTPFSRAYLRTEGIALTRLFSSTSASADDCVAAASELSSLAGSASVSSADSLLSLPLNSMSSASGASILTIVSPTTATVPSSTSTSSTVPDTGDGISTTDLSFCTSAKTSSSSILSPALTNHFTISPSWIPSPISGNLNSNATLLSS